MSIVYSQCTVAVLAIYIYLCRFLQIDHLYGLLMDHEKLCYFIAKTGSKCGLHSEFSHIWKAYLTLEIVKQNKCPEYC